MRPSDKTYFTHLPTGKIRANPFNPRKTFDQESLDELAASLATHGVLQPLIVYEDETFFVLICGERRLRAARQAGLPEVPAIVHPIPPENPQMLSMMLIENLQRKEVDVVNESAAIRLLIEEHNWSVARVSRSLGAGAAYVRKRYLLTKFSDVLVAFTNNTISYSEAIELASIEDETVRKWFFRRIESGELADLKKLATAVSRDKQIHNLLGKGTFLKQALDRSAVEFQVDGLPYCDPKCPHYFRISWDEKQQYKIPHRKPGWAEFCTDKCGSCYTQKVNAKQTKLSALRSLKAQRPIADDDFSSMMWLNYEGKSCRTCPWMVETTALEEAGLTPPPKAHAVCSCPSPECYDKRTHVLNKRASRLDLQKQQSDDLKRKILLKELKTPSNKLSQNPRPQLTKRECAFILLQTISLLGGHARIRDFAERHGWADKMPAQTYAQVKFVRNKILDEMSEADLYEALLNEACLSAAYTTEPFVPLRFRRDVQSEVPVQTKEVDE
ncbi:MAG TPA: ParB/RepB/Spo0J family partition protein [Verrucomicrobiae bacterium]|jgi:ParB/RepB/Spo0J family partition protein